MAENTTKPGGAQLVGYDYINLTCGACDEGIDIEPRYETADEAEAASSGTHFTIALVVEDDIDG